MKHLFCKLLLVVFIFPTAAFGQSGVKSQIKLVQQGLLPAENSNRAEILKKLEAPATNQADQPKKARVNGVELHYLERGEGTPVVFVHGGLDDYRYWQSEMEPFSVHYRVVAYSRRYNYPNNNPLMRPEHSALVEAQDLAALIKSLKLGRVHIVGASYGAYTALLLALRHPEMVHTLILAEPPVLRLAQDNPQGRALYEELMANLMRPVGEAFRRGAGEQALRLTVEYFLGKGTFDQAPEALRQSLTDNLLEWRALTTSRDAFPAVRRRDIKRMKTPTLMLSGERTLTIHKFVDGQLQAMLQRVERVVIPSASHDMWREHPEVCRQAALAFLARH